MAQTIVLDEHRAFLIIEGEGKFCLDDNSIPYCSGMLIFAFNGERLNVVCNSKTTYFYISFGGTRANEMFRRFGICSSNRSFEGFDGLIPIWNESLVRASDKSIDLAAESVLLYTFSRMDDADSEGAGTVRQVINILEEEFTDPGLSIGVIAERLSYNTKYLSHIFKQKTGSSYSDYLRSLRVKHAVLLFDHGIESVKNVAILCGFSDPLYFSTVFKKHTGLSPREYKAKVSANSSDG